MENSELQKRVRDLRARKGLSQEELAEKSGLSLRTIQRIENGETAPRGDTLKRLAIALEVSPDEIIDWQEQEDKSVLTILNLSQLGFLLFPLLGIIIPLAIWILKKDKIKGVNSIGKSILNFQITWSILLFMLYIIMFLNIFLQLEVITIFGVFAGIAALYIYNLAFVFYNTVKYDKRDRVTYVPAIRFLN